MQKLCANVTNGPRNNFNVWTKNSIKSKDFKQFTTWNGLSRKSKFLWCPQPCKRQSSVNRGAWLRRFADVSGVAKTDIVCLAVRTKR